MRKKVEKREKRNVSTTRLLDTSNDVSPPEKMMEKNSTCDNIFSASREFTASTECADFNLQLSYLA